MDLLQEGKHVHSQPVGGVASAGVNLPANARQCPHLREKGKCWECRLDAFSAPTVSQVGGGAGAGGGGAGGAGEVGRGSFLDNLEEMRKELPAIPLPSEWAPQEGRVWNDDAFAFWQTSSVQPPCTPPPLPPRPTDMPVGLTDNEKMVRSAKRLDDQARSPPSSPIPAIRQIRMSSEWVPREYNW